MGEAKRRRLMTVKQPSNQSVDPMVIDTPGGRYHVKWDFNQSATPYAQLAFFAEFLQVTGLYDRWVESCPLEYTSPNAPKKKDVLGTWLMSILAGHNRYAHITGLRADGVSPQVLGMTRVISEDSLRRSLDRMTEEQSEKWLVPQLLLSVQDALTHPWVLDIDTTVKVLYGKQEGAEVGYNPHKPGRPSHALHTYIVGNLRLVLDVVVSAGNNSSANHAQPGLHAILDQLKPEQRPMLVRGDCGFGNDPVITALEKRGQSYLFKLRQSPGVKHLLSRLFSRKDWTIPGGLDQGWSAVEDCLQLKGWTCARRVIVLRRPLKNDVAASKKIDDSQYELLLPMEDVKLWEYAVLVTNSALPLTSMGQLYRDRADAENTFDEIKNQWGWGGFTTRDIKRCQTSARAVALIYNWWSWYCRGAQPDHRMEAITSRRLMLAAVGKSVNHAGQTTIHVTPMHASRKKLLELVGKVQIALKHVKDAAEQLPEIDRWRTYLMYVIGLMIRPMVLESPHQRLICSG